MFSSTKRVAVTIVVACGVSFLGLGTAALIAGSSPAVAAGGTCQSGTSASRPAEPAGRNRANPISRVNPDTGSSDSPAVSTNAPVDSTPSGSLINTNAPVQAQGASAHGGAPLVNTNAPVRAQSPATGGSSSLVNTPTLPSVADWPGSTPQV